MDGLEKPFKGRAFRDDLRTMTQERPDEVLAATAATKLLSVMAAPGDGDGELDFHDDNSHKHQYYSCLGA